MSDRQPLRVLMVEDNPDDAELILREVQRGPYDVTYDRVESGPELKAALAAGIWDVVLCDYNLPGFSAPDALAVLKDAGRHIPFIIVSGTVGEETAVAALKGGADDFLVKGRLTRLLPAIARGLQDRTARAERRAAQEALARSEAQYRSLVDRAVFGLCQVNADGLVVTANPALGAMLGLATPADVATVSLYDLFADAGDREELRRRLTSGERVVGAEATWQRRDGETIRVRLSGGRMGPAGRLGGDIVELIVEDVTTQHHLQEELRQAQKVEALGQLAGGIAHDFNNLLTAILGFTELLREQIGPEGAGAADVREIQAAAERAAALTRQLLAFSRKQPITVKPLDLNDVISNLQPMLRRLLGERVKIDIRLERQLDAVMADATQMEQVIVNLAVNARDAMPAGGTLTIETRNAVRETEFRMMDLGNNASAYSLLRVTDTGTGMSSRIMARVFEPFFTTKERGKGTGLGLSAVYGIVKQLGGAIYIDSEPGRGTTFTIYLPKTDRASQAPVTRPGVVAAPAGRETILLVEDEASVRTFARVALSRHGYTILEAQSAEGALALLADPSVPIDLVLTDVVLPGLSGRDLVARIAKERPAIRTLLMSGYVEQPESLRASGAMPPLLDKPFSSQTLLTRVREVLGEPVLAH